MVYTHVTCLLPPPESSQAVLPVYAIAMLCKSLFPCKTCALRCFMWAQVCLDMHQIEIMPRTVLPASHCMQTKTLAQHCSSMQSRPAAHARCLTGPSWTCIQCVAYNSVAAYSCVEVMQCKAIHSNKHDLLIVKQSPSVQQPSAIISGCLDILSCKHLLSAAPTVAQCCA